VCSFPVRSGGIGLLGDGYEVVEGLDLDVRGKGRLAASVEELVSERDAVRELGVL
jgi:malate dehydrogenase